MSVLSRYYELLTFITIANGEVKEIDPDTPYTIVYYQDSRMLSQSTGLVRGIVGESKYIVTIPLDAEDVNYSTIINTSSIVSIDPYSFDAHFDNFNNWIGVEVAEHNAIQLRVKFVNAESIVMVEQGKTYEVGFVKSGNGTSNYITATGKVKSIIRNTTKEAMPGHINHFTNDIDYMIVFDFGTQLDSSIMSINATDIRVIRPYINPIKYSVGLLNELQTEVDTCKSYKIDWRDYTHNSYDKFKDALLKALSVLNTSRESITDAMIMDALDNLKAAYNALQDIEDVYDIVEYDKDSNMLLCNESIYPVLIRGLGNNCVEVVHYTNFGVRKSMHIYNSNKLEVVWSGNDSNKYVNRVLPDEDLIKEVRKDFFDTFEFVNTPPNCRLFIYNCTLASVDLGTWVKTVESFDGTKSMIGVYGNKLPLASPVTYIYYATINDLYVSGARADFISKHGNVVIKSGSIKGITIGGNDAVLFDRSTSTHPEFNCFDTTLLIEDTECDSIICGGLNTKTRNVTVSLYGNATVQYLNTGGLGGSYTHAVNVLLKETDIGDSPYVKEFVICGGENNTVKDVHVYTEGCIDDITMGAYDIENTDKPSIIETLPNSPTIRLELGKNALIDNIYKGYSNGDILPEEGNIDIIYSVVSYNEYSKLNPNPEPPTEEIPTDPQPDNPEPDVGDDKGDEDSNV